MRSKWVANKKMKITANINISRMPEDVFPWVADPNKARKWQRNVKGGEIIKKTKEIVGTTFKETMEENGKSLEMHGEITGYDRNKSISFHLESKMHQVDVKYTIEREGEKSNFTMEADIYWKFPMNVISFFIGSMMKKSIQSQTKSELVELKRLSEAG